MGNIELPITIIRDPSKPRALLLLRLFQLVAMLYKRGTGDSTRTLLRCRVALCIRPYSSIFIILLVVGLVVLVLVVTLLRCGGSSSAGSSSSSGSSAISSGAAKKSDSSASQSSSSRMPKGMGLGVNKSHKLPVRQSSKVSKNFRDSKNCSLLIRVSNSVVEIN